MNDTKEFKGLLLDFVYAIKSNKSEYENKVAVDLIKYYEAKVKEAYDKGFNDGSMNIHQD